MALLMKLLSSFFVRPVQGAFFPCRRAGDCTAGTYASTSSFANRPPGPVAGTSHRAELMLVEQTLSSRHDNPAAKPPIATTADEHAGSRGNARRSRRGTRYSALAWGAVAGWGAVLAGRRLATRFGFHTHANTRNRLARTSATPSVCLMIPCKKTARWGPGICYRRLFSVLDFNEILTTPDPIAFLL